MVIKKEYEGYRNGNQKKIIAIECKDFPTTVILLIQADLYLNSTS